MTTPLLLSLRPRFADLVFNGLKQAELRRRFTRFANNRDVYIYVTSPERVLRGGFRVDQIWEGTPEEIWKEVSALAGIDRSHFDAYYRGSAVAYALGIADVWELEAPIRLRELRDSLGHFVVPQSWRYVKAEEAQFFSEYMRLTTVLNLETVRQHGMNSFTDHAFGNDAASDWQHP